MGLFKAQKDGSEGRALACRPKDQILIPGSHKMERKKKKKTIPRYCPLTPKVCHSTHAPTLTHRYACVCAFTHTHTQFKNNIIIMSIARYVHWNNSGTNFME